MFIFMFLAGYLLLVSFALFSHVVMGKNLRIFQEKIDEKKAYWRKHIIACYGRCKWQLKRREIKKLRKPYMLVAFGSVLMEMEKEQLKSFLNYNREGISGIGYRINNMLKAYMAYLYSRLPIEGSSLSPSYDRLMFNYLESKSVFVRENALKALYHMGREDSILYAYEKLSDKHCHHCEKLLTEGLSQFNGDNELLAYKLVLGFQHFESCYRTAIVNFLSYSGEHRFDYAMIYYFNNTEHSVDTRCSIIRLLGKAINDDNRQFLLSCVTQENEDEVWEIKAVACGILGVFKNNRDVVDTLINALYSKNWYVRKNAATSLCKLGISREQLDEINNGADEYAKNAINYAIVKA